MITWDQHTGLLNAGKPSQAAGIYRSRVAQYAPLLHWYCRHDCSSVLIWRPRKTHFSNTYLLNASYQPITLNDADATRIELHWLEYWSCVSYKGKTYCTVQCVPCTNMMKKTSALKQLLETSEVTCIAWAWDQILAVVAIFWRRQNKMQKGLFIMHLVHVKETQVAKIDPECPTKAYLINISWYWHIKTQNVINSFCV